MTTRYATDMVTFYDPSFWGLADDQALREFTAASPDKFWGTVMDSLVAAGVQDVELTFAPGDPASVLAAFGSPEAFRAEMSSRGLGVISAFIGESDNVDWRDVTDVSAVVADAEARAAFLAAAGGSVLVTGLPMRKTFGARPPFFVDAAYMGRMAEIAHAVGEATLQQGIRTAFHTESSSSLWYERDIDLFMQFTDPRYVYLCPDSCHITLSGGDPVALANRHLQRIALAHWKDATGVMDIHPVIDETIFKTQQAFMTELGTGVVDWAGWSEAMLRTPGAGTVLVELDEAADPVAAMAAGRAVVEAVRA